MKWSISRKYNKGKPHRRCRASLWTALLAASCTALLTGCGGSYVQRQGSTPSEIGDASPPSPSSARKSSSTSTPSSRSYAPAILVRKSGAVTAAGSGASSTNVTGVWIDSYGYEWFLTQNASGNITGNVQNVATGGCDVNYWSAQGTLTSPTTFTLTATIPNYSAACSSSFTYTLTLSTSLTSASGPWTSYDSSGNVINTGTVSMTTSGSTLTVAANGTALTSNTCETAPDPNPASISTGNPPQMPTMVAQLNGAVLTGNVNWQLNTLYAAQDGTTFAYQTPPTTLPATQAWTIPFTNGVIGGNATLTYTYNGTTNSFTFCINGTNPSTAVVRGLLGNSPWYLIRIAERESGLEQFADGGTPLWGTPAGFGIMQIDTSGQGIPPLQTNLFSWTANIANGKVKVNNDQSVGLSWWNSQVMQYQAWLASNPSSPPPADTPEGSNGNSCTFSYHTPTGGTYPFSDAIAIQNYNGDHNFGTGSNAYFISWNNVGAYKMNPIWTTNDTGYVAAVCSESP